MERSNRALLDEWTCTRPTGPKPNDAKRYRHGYTPNITTAATPHSAATPPRAAFLTSQASTPDM
ncbi:hypothetical protein GCM10017566_37290 [Amycolatopsis bartoniae]|uniref:Uncharacterized protein n=1 Tax=Amycolatopsis bartoniae TaxID=941986 RepID=A0A8H9MAW0_9PSEU|nr:hypothetical protein GCM10017566_37290 [Amycolatopsis bartoniae]